MRGIHSLQQSSLDPLAWDRLIEADPRGHLLQTWAWGQLKGEFGWTAVRAAVEQDGALLAGAQILYRCLGPVSLGYIPKGPAWAQADPAVVETLWRTIHAVSRRMRAIALKVEPCWLDNEDAQHRPLLGAQGWRASDSIQPRSTIVVDLQGDEQAILARMKPKWRYNIRLSERKGVAVHEGSVDDVATFHALMRLTGQRDAFGIHSEPYYRRAFELFAPQGRVKLLLASYKGEPLAGLMAYAFNGQACYMYGASSDAHRELMPNHQLQWCAMQWARSLGCQAYDLWGIPDVEADPLSATLAGVERFKGGFGGEIVRLAEARDWVYSRPLYWALNRALAYRRARRAQAR